MKILPVWKPAAPWVHQQERWINREVKALGQATLATLVKQAAAARRISYAPYSQYHVGAAVVTASGRVYQGTNIERASYSETLHGEEAAIAAAVLDGELERSGRRFLKALAVAHTSDTAPCGHCRQIMAEHADNCLVLVADETGTVRRATSLALLLPYAFTPSDVEFITI